jgi:hypothetical protein
MPRVRRAAGARADRDVVGGVPDAGGIDAADANPLLRLWGMRHVLEVRHPLAARSRTPDVARIRAAATTRRAATVKSAATAGPAVPARPKGPCSFRSTMRPGSGNYARLCLSRHGSSPHNANGPTLSWRMDPFAPTPVSVPAPWPDVPGAPEATVDLCHTREARVCRYFFSSAKCTLVAMRASPAPGMKWTVTSEPALVDRPETCSCAPMTFVLSV